MSQGPRKFPGAVWSKEMSVSGEDDEGIKVGNRGERALKSALKHCDRCEVSLFVSRK